MLGKMKLTHDEVNNRPWDIVTKIEKIIRGKESNKVRFKGVHGGSSIYRPSLACVSIETYDMDYKSVYRRVKVIFTKDRKYEIDLDKIKAKYEEMKKIALKFEKNRKIREEYGKQNEKLISRLKGEREDIDIVGANNNFSIEIYGLKEKEVRKVVEFIKVLKLRNTNFFLEWDKTIKKLF